MKKNTHQCILAAVCLLLTIGNTAYTQSKKENGDLKHFPKGSTPEEIGKRVADHFIATPHTNFGRPTPPRVITYPETCTWYGALTFAKESYVAATDR